MKKIFITALLMISIIPVFGMGVFAADIDTENQYEEEYSLYYSDLLMNGEPVTTATDLHLTDNAYDTVTFLLSDVLSNIEPAEGYEVQAITLKINLGIYYISDNVEIYTYDDELTEYNYTYESADDEPLYEASQFWLDIDPEDFQDITEHSSEFNYTRDHETTFPAKIGDRWIEVLYMKSIDSFSDVIDCESDYSLLPNTDEEFLDILSIEEYDEETHSHKLSFAFGSQLYYFNVAIPGEIYNHVFSSEWNETIRFTDIQANQMSFATSSEGEQILYIQPDNIEPNKPAIIEDGDTPDIEGFVVINLSDMEYNVINKLELIGVVNKEDNRYASLYCFFPTRVEDLLSITVTYEYRINSILGIKGDWQTALNTYVRGDTYDGQSPSWMWWVPGLGWGWIAGSAITGNSIYDIDNVITSIDEEDIPDDVVYSYETELGGSASDLDDLQLYKVNLGQYQDGFFTAFSDENAYDIEELVILEILYEYNGIVYEATTEDIDSNVVTPDLSTGILDGLFDGLFDNSTVMYIAAGVVGVVIFNKLELSKKPGLLIILVAGIVYVLHILGVITWFQ
jgi:hypothetical protein